MPKVLCWIFFSQCKSSHTSLAKSLTSWGWVVYLSLIICIWVWMYRCVWKVYEVYYTSCGQNQKKNFKTRNTFCAIWTCLMINLSSVNVLSLWSFHDLQPPKKHQHGSHVRLNFKNHGEETPQWKWWQRCLRVGELGVVPGSSWNLWSFFWWTIKTDILHTCKIVVRDILTLDEGPLYSAWVCWRIIHLANLLNHVRLFLCKSLLAAVYLFALVPCSPLCQTEEPF